jgi:hypothetical protein
MKENRYNNYRQFIFTKNTPKNGEIKKNPGIPGLHKELKGEDLKIVPQFWKPTRTSGNNQLQFNDYQYIKSKWLLELLTGYGVNLHKDYGFTVKTPRPLTHWPRELLGNGYRLYNAALINLSGVKKTAPNRMGY